MPKYELKNIVDGDMLPDLQKMDTFLEVINLSPPVEWIDEHPLAKGVKYMPIGRVEQLLTKIFQQWRIEILREGQLLNSVYCTVRLHYKLPVTGEWTYQDGTGAVPVKTDKGAHASDMSAIKSDGVSTGLPAAKSFAIKDAADHIGRIFGRDINRKGNLAFAGSYIDSEDETILKRIKNAQSGKELTNILLSLNPEKKKAYTSAIQNRQKELANAA